MSPQRFGLRRRRQGQLIEGWRKQKPEFFGEDMTDAQIRALGHSAEPVVSWQILDMRGSDGRLARARLTKNGEGANSWGGETALEVPFALGSRYMNQVHYEFGASVVVIDAKAVAGADLRQLADFAAMQLFAHTDPTRPQSKLRRDPDVRPRRRRRKPSPLSVTEWDFAYLNRFTPIRTCTRRGAPGRLAKRMARYMTEDGRYSRRSPPNDRRAVLVRHAAAAAGADRQLRA